jgi:hypothetical protein
VSFDTVQIRSKVNGTLPVFGYRDDLLVGDTVSLSLSDTTGVDPSGTEWWLVGRPEGSVVGFAGPEPIFLGGGLTVSFVVDDDTLYPRDGSYLIQCVVRNFPVGPNPPTRVTRIPVLLARLSGLTLPDGRELRMPAAYETGEDTENPIIKLGTSKMINRWLRRVATLIGTAEQGKRISLTRGFGTVTHGSADTFGVYYSWAVDFDQFDATEVRFRLWVEARLVGAATSNGTVLLAIQPNGVARGAAPPGGSAGVTSVGVLSTSWTSLAITSIPFARPSGVKVVGVWLLAGFTSGGEGPPIPTPIFAAGPVVVVEPV